MPKPRPKEESKKLHARIRNLTSLEYTVVEIARRCRCSRSLVYYVQGKPHMGRFERAAARRKLWAEQRALGMSIKEIARTSKVSYSTVFLSLQRAAAGAST